MSEEKTIELTIDNSRFTFPVYQTPAKTEEIANKINEHIQRLANTPGEKFNSLKFLTKTAFHFAVEAQKLADEKKADEEEILKRLNNIIEKLRIMQALNDK